jgi:putative adhesin
MKLPSISPATATAAAVLALAVSSPAQAQRDFDWSGEVAPGATLRVFTTSGTVTVRQAAGRTVRIHGETVNASGGDQIRYVNRSSGGNVLVCALRERDSCDENGMESRGDGWRSGSRRARGNFTVEVPRGVVVRAASGNGDVTVDGATADVNASSGNGDVRVGAGAGQVRATSGNGAVMVDGARGPVNASSGNGRVSITTASGPVSASTGNGRIEVAISSLRGAGDMTFSSGNGSVTLTLPADFSADLEASTGNGGFESDFPLRVVGRMSPHRVSGTIGQGGRRLHISTGNGSIVLRRAGT